MSVKCNEEWIICSPGRDSNAEVKKANHNLNELTDKPPEDPVYLLKRTKYAW